MVLLSGGRTRHQRKSIVAIYELMYKEKDIQRSLNCGQLQFEGEKKVMAWETVITKLGRIGENYTKNVLNNHITAEKEWSLTN